MKRISVTVLSSMLVMSCIAAAPEDRLHFKENGFSIAPLEGVSNQTASMALIMMLPVMEGFAPNVNVIIQPYNGTLLQFAEISRTNFKSAGYEVLKETASGNSITWEYAGEYQGHKMHWYAAAVQGKGRVFVVTATSLESQWVSVSPKLKACVDSFKVDADNARPAKPAA